MTESEAINELHKIRPRGGIIPQKRAEALDIAIKALEKQIAEEHNNGWIPLSERLPNQDGEFTDVLITCESMADGVFVQSAEFYIASDGEPVFDALYHYERVIAWQPLPLPYKERDNNAKM